MATTKYISKILANYTKQGYTLCPDTSFLINCNEALANLNEPISISKEVFAELDQLKNAPANANPVERRTALEARKAFDLLDTTKATIVKEAPEEVFTKYNLPKNEEGQLIANYLHYRDLENKKVVFLSLHESEQALAKQVGLECAEIDSRKFDKARAKEYNVYTVDEIASGKKVNPIHRFFRKIYFFVREVNRIGKMIVYGIIILIVILGVIANLISG